MQRKEFNSNLFPLLRALTGHASTQPTHAPLHPQLEHLPSFQQHLSKFIFNGIKNIIMHLIKNVSNRVVP
jgi:hypothetical protein